MLKNLTNSVPEPNVLNFGSLSFGQYITEDISLREFYQNSTYYLIFSKTILFVLKYYVSDNGGFGLRYCSVDYKHSLPDQLSYYGCEPISIPKDDPFFSKFDMECMTFIRSQPVFPNDCSLGPAQMVPIQFLYIL